MTLPRLENWRFTKSPDPYLAPELNRPRLVGKVFGHPESSRSDGRRRDGQVITTSPVVGITDGFAITRSGSRYQLGAPDPEYVAWMVERYPGWDPARPLDVPKSAEVVS